MPDSAFAVLNPRAHTEAQRRKYPITNRSHARNALSRVSRFGNPRERMLVCKKVHKLFPDVHTSKCPMPYGAHHASMKRLTA